MASIRAPGNTNVYAATKGFVGSFSTSMAVEGAEYNVRVNAVNPGLTISEGTIDWLGNAAKATEFGPALTLTNKPATGKEIAEFLLHVASTRYINGDKLVIDGGYLAK